MSRILGIDPGIAGAVAVIEIVDGIDGITPKLVDVIDIPILGIAAKTRIDAIGLRNWIETHHPNFAGVERAGSMPRQGVASAFKYGRAAHAFTCRARPCGRTPASMIDYHRCRCSTPMAMQYSTAEARW